jgi:hypothetical protein
MVTADTSAIKSTNEQDCYPKWPISRPCKGWSWGRIDVKRKDQLYMHLSRHAKCWQIQQAAGLIGSTYHKIADDRDPSLEEGHVTVHT